MDKLQDTIRFSTGQERYANNGFIGIGPDCEEVTEGYDGSFYNDKYYPDEALTSEECLELADLMLRRWNKFRALHAARLARPTDETEPKCDQCGRSYPMAGDGCAGLCPECADKKQAEEDKKETEPS